MFLDPSKLLLTNQMFVSNLLRIIQRVCVRVLFSGFTWCDFAWGCSSFRMIPGHLYPDLICVPYPNQYQWRPNPVGTGPNREIPIFLNGTQSYFQGITHTVIIKEKYYWVNSYWFNISLLLITSKVLKIQKVKKN